MGKVNGMEGDGCEVRVKGREREEWGVEMI